MLHCVALHGSALHCTTLLCMALHCIAIIDYCDQQYCRIQIKPTLGAALLVDTSRKCKIGSI